MGHAELGVALRFGLEGEITMTRKELITLCLRFPDAYEDYPFGSEPDGQTIWPKGYFDNIPLGGICQRFFAPFHEKTERHVLRSVFS